MSSAPRARTREKWTHPLKGHVKFNGGAGISWDDNLVAAPIVYHDRNGVYLGSSMISSQGLSDPMFVGVAYIILHHWNPSLVLKLSFYWWRSWHPKPFRGVGYQGNYQSYSGRRRRELWMSYQGDANLDEFSHFMWISHKNRSSQSG